MNPSVTHFGEISTFGASEPMLALVLGADLVFTGIHVWQEWRGERFPLYRAFGAVVGFWFPRAIGFASFTLGLAVILWAVGIAAYTGLQGTLPMPWSVGALGCVLGARVGDSIISHWSLYLARYRPNPGFSSTLLYMLEAVLIVLAFRPGLSIDSHAAWIGIAIGFGFFFLPLLSMAVLRVFLKSCRRERWVPGEEIPPWAVTT
jgi:hypothetical protein